MYEMAGLVQIFLFINKNERMSKQHLQNIHTAKSICTEKHCNLYIKVQKANSGEKKKFTALKNLAARNMNRNKYSTD